MIKGQNFLIKIMVYEIFIRIKKNTQTFGKELIQLNWEGGSDIDPEREKKIRYLNIFIKNSGY